MRVCLLRVFNRQYPTLYGELRWDPVHGERGSFCGLSPSFGDDEVKRVRQWLRATQRHVQGGRPLESGKIPTARDLIDVVKAEVERQYKPGERPKQLAIAAGLMGAYFNTDDAYYAKRMLQRRASDFGLSWNDILRDIGWR
jgi:hypothetical protein